VRHGPSSTDSVVPVMPNSGVLVLPRKTTPASRKRRVRTLSAAGTSSFVKRLPLVRGQPPTGQPRSFTRNGTPVNGPSGSLPPAVLRASS